MIFGVVLSILCIILISAIITSISKKYIKKICKRNYTNVKHLSKFKKVLLSYPRSGNHLVRFFIELLSETPTFGCEGNTSDRNIYKNVFPEKIPFNISNFDKEDCFFKFHHISPSAKFAALDKLILIVRNPREVLLRHNKFNLNFTYFKKYFDCIDFFNKFEGEKLLLFYEDILTNKKEFIDKLYKFLDLKNPEKKKYVLSNLDKLYKLSAQGKQRSWGGINSNSINYYYKKLSNEKKQKFDNYLNNQLVNYPFLKKKYAL